jgi:hypothetical protein
LRETSTKPSARCACWLSAFSNSVSLPSSVKPRARPVFHRGHQRASHAGAARVRVDPPAFDERARMLVDALGPWTNARLDKAADIAVRSLSHEDGQIGIW